MPTTRSAEKKANGAGDESAGSKHELSDKSSPTAKRSKKADDKEQKTIEESMPSATEAYGEGKASSEKKHEEEDDVKTHDDEKEEAQVEKAQDDENIESEKAQDDEKMEDVHESNGDAEVKGARSDEMPSSILEKGLIYFFFRGRVGVDDPSDVKDIARTYMILRPMAWDAKLGEGPIDDNGKSRLIAVPKKVFPISGKERWIAFVEKSHTSFKTLKDEFFASSDYDTKTAGTRHSPAATPAAEGVYIISTTTRESHLAYMITLPSELGEIQNDLGLREKGSFILSTRNPQFKAPRGTALPQAPDYPKEVLDSFRSLRWMPTEPKHLEYPNTQFLLIGEASHIEKVDDMNKKDQKEDKEKPLEELEKLEDEDTHRMEELKAPEESAIWTDLHVRSEDYPKLGTTF